MLAQRQPSFKECVTAHWSSGLAPKMIGAKSVTEATDAFVCLANKCVVGEHSAQGRRSTVRSSGQRGRDYAGISSEKTREKRVRRKSKVSWGRLIRPGLVDPKLRPKGVSDG